ncbi:Solanesyl diphosphate synthase 3, chloroplastic/mitochondrial [Morella rubra]|uniref:Solanesyl diphosphate synthase 3, chloroplastic/mitochondrial n=1 Tax=Morella rubra TaxID=262757 RepID=A0A6A1WBN8_9ROSI|nr:Solanesyl diphosphate synthase 3, chloroplastic/mitochondrial [Morella rubra]
MSVFNHCFRIESKEFQVRISAKGDILFLEWSSRFVNVIHMGKYGVVWMVNMSDKLMAASPVVEFASKFNESRRGFLAQLCCSKGGRYVAVVEYGGRRKVGAVMVPEGKNGSGWQILNRVFLDVVSCVRSTNLSVNHVDSSSIRPEVSFAKVVLAPAVVNGEGGRSSALVQNSGVAETSRNLHATEAADVMFPKLIFSSMSKEKASVGKCPAGSEYGLKSGGPKHGEGDLGPEGPGEELGRAEDAMESHYADQGGVDGFDVAQGGLGVSFNSFGAHTKLAEVSSGLSVVVGGISSGSLASEFPADGQLLESECLSLLQVPSPKLSASVGDLPIGLPASELQLPKMQLPFLCSRCLLWTSQRWKWVSLVSRHQGESRWWSASFAPATSALFFSAVGGGSAQNSEVLGAVSCISPMEEQSTFELNRLFAEVGEPSGNNRIHFHLLLTNYLLANRLRSMVVAEVPKLASAAEYFFKMGVEGKRFRPTVLLLMATALNVSLTELSPSGPGDALTQELRVRQQCIAEITEMIHVASLLHDDVLDDADTRRGIGSLNCVMGNKLAVLAGDFLLSRACVALASLENTEVVSLLAKVVEHLVTGETMQMTTTAEQRCSMEYYMEKTYYKTASLISNSCKAIALLAGQTAEVAILAYEYGRNLGLAFQLIDDVLDFMGTSASLGKGSLSDIRHGIITAPILFAMEEFPQLHTVVEQGFDDPANVDLALEFLGKSRGMQKARELATKHANLAAAAIDSLPYSDDEEVRRSRRALVDLTQIVITRTK